MNRVWVRCLIMPSAVKDENIYRICKYDGTYLEGAAGRLYIVPTNSTSLPIERKSKEQLESERNARKAARLQAREERRQARIMGEKPVWPKRDKQKARKLVMIWGAVVSRLLKEIDDKAIIALPDGKVAEIKTVRILTREDAAKT